MGSGASNGASLGCLGVEHGGRVDIESEGSGGDCLGEEDEKCWLVIGICSFRRITSSLETMEASVTTK